jgi:hypothetical protein
MNKALHKLLIVTSMCSYSTFCLSETITIQAKSYIAAVNLLDSNQFDSDSKTCQEAMAALVDCGTLDENPSDGTKASKNYRLWSELDVNITCSGNKVASWQLKPIQNDFGSEFVIFATAGDLSKPLKAVPSLTGSAPIDKVSFDYRLRGRPNAAGVAVMNAVKTRTCSYIWHEVSGTLSCQQGQPKVSADIAGSGFPTHRLWINGAKVAEVSQGPFKNLWKCDPTDPTSVR